MITMMRKRFINVDGKWQDCECKVTNENYT